MAPKMKRTDASNTHITNIYCIDGFPPVHTHGLLESSLQKEKRQDLLQKWLSSISWCREWMHYSPNQGWLPRTMVKNLFAELQAVDLVITLVWREVIWSEKVHEWSVAMTWLIGKEPHCFHTGNKEEEKRRGGPTRSKSTRKGNTQQLDSLSLEINIRQALSLSVFCPYTTGP